MGVLFKCLSHGMVHVLYSKRSSLTDLNFNTKNKCVKKFPKEINVLCIVWKSRKNCGNKDTSESQILLDACKLYNTTILTFILRAFPYI